jgi:hypothetical protein
MIRQIRGLAAASNAGEVTDGEYLVRVARAQYHWDKRKPYYSIWFEVIEPVAVAHRGFHGRIYCSPKALWKLNWFLHDFGYDPELLGREELDEQALVGLQGVVKLTYRNVNGNVLLNLDAFSRSENWPKISTGGAEAA